MQPLHSLQGLQDGPLHHQQLQSPPNIQSLAAISPDPNDAGALCPRYLGAPAPQPQHHALHASNPFVHNAGLPHTQNGFQSVPAAGYSLDARFGLMPGPPQHLQASLPVNHSLHHAAHEVPHGVHELGPQPEYVPAQATDDTPVTSHGQFEALKLIPNPPNLDEWRSRLFHVDDTITLTEDE